MRTEFTREEMYEAYYEEIVRYGVRELRMTAEQVDDIMRYVGFKDGFIANISDFDFVTPAEVLDDIIASLRRTDRPRVVERIDGGFRYIGGRKRR